jgi:predicted regulator of Ras-like GTPase activity (Roadblock/LC7/MglB family)
VSAPAVAGIQERLEHTLELTRRTSGCRSIAVTRHDGLVIVHRVEPEHDPRLAAAMAAAAYGSASSISKELGQGKLDRLVAECSEGKIIVLGAGPDAVVIGLYEKNVNLGLALHGLAQAAGEIEKILSELA